MPRPKGLPKTGGRKKGGRNKCNRYLDEVAADAKMSPLQFLLMVMRDETRELELRVSAAAKAAPYVHRILKSTEHTVDPRAIQHKVVLTFDDSFHKPVSEPHPGQSEAPPRPGEQPEPMSGRSSATTRH